MKAGREILFVSVCFQRKDLGVFNTAVSGRRTTRMYLENHYNGGRGIHNRGPSFPFFPLPPLLLPLLLPFSPISATKVLGVKEEEKTRWRGGGASCCSPPIAPGGGGGGVQ